MKIQPLGRSQVVDSYFLSRYEILIENTNDLASGFARMQQERTTYYLLAYQPTNTSTDGRFRKVKVKVKRSGVTVRARPGYVAAQK